MCPSVAMGDDERGDSRRLCVGVRETSIHPLPIPHDTPSKAHSMVLWACRAALAIRVGLLAVSMRLVVACPVDWLPDIETPPVDCSSGGALVVL